jgi:hypothetical protein
MNATLSSLASSAQRCALLLVALYLALLGTVTVGYLIAVLLDLGVLFTERLPLKFSRIIFWCRERWKDEVVNYHLWTMFNRELNCKGGGRFDYYLQDVLAQTWARILCWRFGHEWNVEAAIDPESGGEDHYCIRCGCSPNICWY